MKIIIETVYENVDQKWFEWWLNRIKTQDTLPGSAEMASEIEDWGYAVYRTEDPTSSTVGTTTYRVLGRNP